MTTATTPALVAASVRVILDGQSPSGAYVASPAFSQYGFGWLRDGSYCALAMDAVGERASARAFHDWVAGAIVARADRVDAVVDAVVDGRAPSPELLLPTRYTLDGADETLDDTDGEAWPNFQLDGYGTWLFAVRAHLNGAPVGPWEPAVRLAARYLAATWRLPCFDYWEEFGDRIHTSTLAAIAAGLRAAADLLGEAAWSIESDAVLAVIRTDCVRNGVFVKGPEDDRVDASLVSLSTPFGLVAADDPIMSVTIARIRADLTSPSGGIRRYVGDSYYGGNPWILLTAWLGWHDALAGDEVAARAARDWVLAHQGGDGALPEQLRDEPQLPDRVQEWIDRWGPIADPLLWSHAKYLLLESRAAVTPWR